MLRMAVSKTEIKKRLLNLISDIGEKKDDGYVYYRKDILLNKWDASGFGKFKSTGFGKLSNFLETELSVESISHDKGRIPQSSFCDLDCNNKLCNERSAVDTNKKQTESTKKKSEVQHGYPKATLSELKAKVLNMIKMLIEGKHERQQKDQKVFIVTLEELNIEWQKMSTSHKFADYKCGSFKKFLAEKCHLTSLERDRFEIRPDDIKTELQNIERDNEDLELANNGDAEACINMAASIQTKSDDNIPNQVDKENTAGCSSDGGQFVQISDPDVVSKPGVDTSSNERSQSDEYSTVPAAKPPSERVLPETRIPQSRRHCMQLVSVLYKCGLQSLRELFMKIHPNWSNKPADIAQFDKGTLSFKGKDEIANFKSGDIAKWDITLISKVLLHSKISKEKLSNDRTFVGCKAAVETITAIRNSVQGHNASGELTKHYYDTELDKLCNATVFGLGFDAEDFEKAVEDANLCKDNAFYNTQSQMVLSKLSAIEQLIKDGQNREVPQEEIYEQAKSRIPDWDEWMKISRSLGNFDNKNNQYMLIVDRFDEPDTDLAKILGGIPWKLVIDLDPDSDNTGVFTCIDPKEAQGGLIETITPSKINENHGENFMDTSKMPWVFANGRKMSCTANKEGNDRTAEHCDYKDQPKDILREWKSCFKAPIVELIRTSSDKLDPMKPNFCIILGIRNGLPSKIATILLEEIKERFKFKNFTMGYVAVASELDMEDLDQSNFTASNLSLSSFMHCIASQVGIYGKEDFEVPGKYAGAFVPLKEHYNYLSEYLEILYKGCEDIPRNSSKEEAETFEVEHLKSFISGNPISFPSLFFRHDATRNLVSEIAAYISRLSSNIPRPQIVQITHQPGSGGTTIARRVLWDLHGTFPCAIVKVNFSLENFSQESDGDKLVDNICERIHCLVEDCKGLPIVLIDGNSALVRILSDYIVRNLKVTAIILRCINPTEKRNDNREQDKIYRLYFSREFEVNSNLTGAKSKSDHDAFISKYEYYEKRFQFINKTNEIYMQRVFHFPLMAMLGKFEKLQSIVNQSLDLVIKERSRDYQVAIVVAFLQLYADRGTPASLISKYILKQTYTYDELTRSFSIPLLNLMIPEEAPSRSQHHARKYSRRSPNEKSAKEQSYIIQQYTFQHRKVAEQVLEHSKRKIDVITQEFLKFDVFKSYRSEKEITDVINSLFLHNKSNDNYHFSRLVMELSNVPCGGRILEDAAKQSKDASFYSHVARFFAYRKSNFEKARGLIEEGFKVEESVPSDKKKRVQDTYGHIVLKEMTKADISSVDDLKNYAEEAIDLFRQARENPPRMFPNPLIGEVTVWLFCLEYIIQEYDTDVDKAIDFSLKDEFFCDAIADSIALLDEVDEMVSACAMLPDPRQTERLAYEKRCRLRDLIARTQSRTSRRGYQDTAIFRICRDIANYEKKISKKELLKLQARWLMAQVGNNFALLSEENKIKLFDWLFKLVDEHAIFDYARYLMDVAALHEKPPLAMEKALRITSQWQEARPNDCYGYLYHYILCFSKICNNEVSDYKASYESALESCKKMIQGRLDQHRPKFYVSKDKEKGSICSLVSHAELASISEKYNEKHKGKGRKEDDIDQSFWEEHCQKHLLVCHGRIQHYPKRFGKSRTFIWMEPGLVEINVTRNVAGKAYKDYQPDSKVAFIVALTLAGPKAIEVWFNERHSKVGMESKQYARQGSKNSQRKEK